MFATLCPEHFALRTCAAFRHVSRLILLASGSRDRIPGTGTSVGERKETKGGAGLGSQSGRLIAGCWLLVAGCWLLIAHCSLLAG
jgi:hypothetical protein